MCLHSMGQYYLAVGNGAEASIAFIEALDIARQVYGDEDLQVSICMFGWSDAPNVVTILIPIEFM